MSMTRETLLAAGLVHGVTDAISFVHSAFVPHPKFGVGTLLGMAFLGGGKAFLVISIDI